MTYFMAMLAGICLTQLEGKYFGRIIANYTDSAFFGLANLTLIKMLRQDSELAFQEWVLVAIINIIEVLQTKIIFFEAIVDAVA